MRRRWIASPNQICELDMPEPYSLARQAWLPVALRDGRRVFVRPCDVASKIDGQPIVRVDTGRPDCDGDATELLIGLLAVALGPKDRRDWAKRYTSPPTAQEIDRALRALEVALILDGDGPRFFQDREQLEGEPNSIDALFIDAPGNNAIKENADHFVKRGRSVALSRAGAAIALATLQTSAPAGGAGNRTSLRGGGPLTTLVVPGSAGGTEPTLWQRLWANVPEGFAAGGADLPCVFPWLQPTRVSDKGGKATTPDDVHAAQAFFGMPRRIRLIFQENTSRLPCDLLGNVDDVVVTGFVTRPWGTNYIAWSRGHPLSPYYKPKPTDLEFLPVHLQSSRVGYRDWLGMVMETPTGLQPRVPARCLDDFRKRAEEIEGLEPMAYRGSRLLVTGYAMDNMKPLDFAEALLPLIITGDADANEAIKLLAQSWVAAADAIANQLVLSVKRALFGENGKVDRDNTVLDAVRFRFWAETEGAFYAELRRSSERIEAETGQLADHLDALKEHAGATWLTALKRAALLIFDDAVPIDSAEGDMIEHVIAARRMLVLMLTGYGKGGATLFELLHQPAVATKTKNARKAA
jgi:CRISPR system Cascade subunit CasA